MDAELIDGEPFRLYVQSSSRRQMRFLVDLESYNWNGECSCENFTMTRINDVRAGKRSRCKHLDVGWDTWAMEVAKRIKEKL